MFTFLYVLRRDTKIEINTENNKFDLAVAEDDGEGPVTTADALQYGKLLALLGGLFPVYVIDLPASRLPADTAPDKKVPMLPTGLIVSSKELAAKPEKFGPMFADSFTRQVLEHALIHAEGNVRLGKATEQVGGDGYLIVYGDNDLEPFSTKAA
jgi:hypothetical protein